MIFDPLADEFRYCTHCQADCWLEPENQRHKPHCPTATGLYPVTASDHHPEHGYGCCTACSAPFVLGDHYVLADVDNGQHVTTAERALVVCVSCAALDRNPTEEKP